MSADAVPEPAFRVVKGTPTDEELAALVVVLTARPGPAAEPDPPVRSGWSAYVDGLRRPLHPGPQAWRTSARG